jgi:hypothetical protein
MVVVLAVVVLAAVAACDHSEFGARPNFNWEEDARRATISKTHALGKAEAEAG